MTVTTTNSPAQTTLRLEGAPNFRDLGGYATTDGRTVRRRRLFRSEGLSSLTANDLDTIRHLGIRLVCDVRAQNERDAHPSRWPDGQAVDVLHLDISNDLRAANETLRRILISDVSEKGAREVMFQTYRLMPRAFVGRLATLVDRILAEEGLPAVIHCTAGKDRTGFVSAMLLLALGVSMETVYCDYLLTAELCDLKRMAASSASAIAASLGRMPDPAVAHALSAVCREYLDTAFESLEAEFGSIDTYLQQAGGLTAEKCQRLQARLLE